AVGHISLATWASYWCLDVRGGGFCPKDMPPPLSALAIERSKVVVSHYDEEVRLKLRLFGDTSCRSGPVQHQYRASRQLHRSSAELLCPLNCYCCAGRVCPRYLRRRKPQCQI